MPGWTTQNHRYLCRLNALTTISFRLGAVTRESETTRSCWSGRENPDNAPEALTQRQQTWNSRFFSDLVDSLYNGETDDAATAALAAIDAAADDGMQLWTALKREIDITAPSARSHAKTSSRPKLNKSMTKAVAEFGLRFRGAYANSRTAATLTTTTRSSYPTSSVAPTNARPYTIVSYAQIQKTARRRLALPVQGRGGGRNGGRTGGEEAATPNVSTRSDTTDAAKTQTVQLHTLTTLRCVMRLAARVTTQHVGAATPTQAAEVAVDEADIKVAEADEEDDTRCRAEALVDHPTSHRRTKHIEIRREFIKFHIGHETVKIERVSTKDQLADIMTKPLRQDIHNYLVRMILHG
ncbi:hypothetical protein RI054_27g111860 [Pseudoscourfieldia marina]